MSEAEFSPLRCFLILHARLGAEAARKLLAQRSVGLHPLIRQPAIQKTHSVQQATHCLNKLQLHYLRPVGEPDAPDLMGESGVRECIDPSLDESLLPADMMSTVRFSSVSKHAVQ
jgi:hypothetical protein